MDVIVPGFGDEDDRVGVGGEQRGEAGIVGGRAAGPLGHAEGAEARALGRLALEEFGVDRIGAGIAALDIVDAECDRAWRRSGACLRARNRRPSSARRRAESCRRDRGVHASWEKRSSVALRACRRPASRGRARAAWSSSYWRAIRRSIGRDCAAGRRTLAARRAACAVSLTSLDNRFAPRACARRASASIRAAPTPRRAKSGST